MWPDNWAAVRVLLRAMTQWNVGMAGAVGLRYEVLPFLLRLEAVPRQEWQQVVTGVQVMEAECLRLRREKVR